MPESQCAVQQQTRYVGVKHTARAPVTAELRGTGCMCAPWRRPVQPVCSMRSSRQAVVWHSGECVSLTHGASQLNAAPQARRSQCRRLCGCLVAVSAALLAFYLSYVHTLATLRAYSSRMPLYKKKVLSIDNRLSLLYDYQSQFRHCFLGLTFK